MRPFFNLLSALLGIIQPLKLEIAYGLQVVGQRDGRIQFEGSSRCSNGFLVFLILELQAGQIDIGRNVFGVNRDRLGEGLAGLFGVMSGGINAAQLIPSGGIVVVFRDSFLEMFGRRLQFVVADILVALLEFLAGAARNQQRGHADGGPWHSCNARQAHRADIHGAQFGRAADNMRGGSIAVDHDSQLAARQIAQTVADPTIRTRRHRAAHANHADRGTVGGAEIGIALGAGSQDKLKIALQIGLNYLQEVRTAIELHRDRFRGRLVGVHEEDPSVDIERRLQLRSRWAHRGRLPRRIRSRTSGWTRRSGWPLPWRA